MNSSIIGLIVGLLLAIALVAGGLLGLLLAIVLGGGGFLVGGHLGGDLDLGSIVRTRRD